MITDQILGMNVNPSTYRNVVETIRGWLRERIPQSEPGASANSPHGRFISIAAVFNIVSALKDPQLMQIENSADLVTTDGMPLVWVLRRRGYRECERVYGPTLMLETLKMAEQDGYPSFFYGCTEQILGKLLLNLKLRYPRLKVAGCYAPPFRPLTPEENQQVVDQIIRSGARLVWVGISSPKQEYWMHQNRPRLPGSVMLGVGAAFLFHSGTIKQAPEVMQRLGLEWLFRLCIEPKRLWRRYLFGNSYFLWRLMTDRWKRLLT